MKLMYSYIVCRNLTKIPISENHDLLRAFEQGGGGGGGGGGVAAGIPAINITIHSPNANHVLGEYTCPILPEF